MLSISNLIYIKNKNIFSVLYLELSEVQVPLSRIYILNPYFVVSYHDILSIFLSNYSLHSNKNLKITWLNIQVLYLDKSQFTNL